MTPASDTRRPADPAAGVRLEVRVGSDAPRSYELASGQFLVGAADGCDLRLIAAGMPPVACVFRLTPDGPTVRRHDRLYSVLVNETGLPDLNPVPLCPGDRVTVGPAMLAVAAAPTIGLLRPQFVAILPTPPPAPTSRQPVGEPADLAALRLQVQGFAAERAVWERRRAELDAECQRLRESAATGSTRDQLDLLSARVELESARRSLEAQYHERREQLAQMQEVVRGATTALHEREQRFETDTARRAAELDARERDLEAQAGAHREYTRQTVEADLAKRSQELADGFLRLDRQQAALEARQREVERHAAEADERVEQLRRASRELEEQVGLAEAEHDHLAVESARLVRLKADLAGHANRQAERSAQLEAQQAMLAVLRSRLDRREEELRQEATQVAADRSRVDDAQRHLDDRLREADRLHAELSSARDGHAEREQVIVERAALLDATLAEIRQQKEANATEHARLQAKEQELDERSADLAEQTAVLKARAVQVQELQARLEADRSAVRERETSVADSDAARQAFQEQLRRRADELATRGRHQDEAGQRLVAERAELDELRATLLADRDRGNTDLAAARTDLASEADALTRRATELADREIALERQVARLREAGRATAAARKELAEARRQAERDRSAADLATTEADARLASLKREAPELERQAHTALDRLTAARETLQGHLGELHRYAGLSRDELDAARSELRVEADRLRERDAAFQRARDDHRLTVAGFRQQLLEWQSRVADLKRELTASETRLDDRRTEATESAREATVAALELARQTEELRREREQVAERRAEIERHLADMREWYRKKLKELAASKVEPPSAVPSPLDLDPGDRKLGELLRSLELVDADTLAALWDEAGRQRRTLRQVLLASGAVTLYQLALIEAGNLDHLMLGRFRVLDRVRTTAHETVYRVFDPDRPAASARGGLVLRHLAEGEIQDAVRPDEFRQRFATAREAAHRNLQTSFEVVEVNGRPAVLQEWLTGLPSADWPAEAAAPGVWVRLVSEVASGLAAAHAAGLTHGRLTADAVALTPDGVVKLTGVGVPPWLGSPTVSDNPTPADDLRALGRLAYNWGLLGQPAGPRRRRTKGLPDSLAAVVRRLEADPETPMADTVAGAVPYRSASELVADLTRLAALFPAPSDVWERLVEFAAESGADTLAFRRSA